jgi:hypothetical protein
MLCTQEESASRTILKVLNAHKIHVKIFCNELDSQMLSCGIFANMLQIKYKVGLCTIEWVTFGHVS